MRLSTSIWLFDTQLRADGKSEHTIGAYLRDLARFRDWLTTDPDVISITSARIASYLAVDSNGGTAISINRTKTALRMFFKFLTDVGYVKTNPARLKFKWVLPLLFAGLCRNSHAATKSVLGFALRSLSPPQARLLSRSAEVLQ